MKKLPLIALASVAIIAAVVAAVFISRSSTTTATSLGAPGVDVSAFKDGSLTEAIAEEPCTLTNGEETTCYRITVTGTPVGTTIGPFCPATTSASAEDSGIWLDGSKIYDVDGQFILDLSEIYGDAKWKLYDEQGNVNVTDTKEAFQGAAQPEVDEAYKYHCVEGKYEWTETGEAVPISVLVPMNPVKASSASTTQGTDLGVTVNGLVIAPSAPVDAILGAYTIAAFDDCGGHFNPFEGYHLHAYTNCEGTSYGADITDPNAETQLIGYALDGVAVFAPLAANSTIELDECNGRTTDADGYHYYAQSAEKNLTIKCFMGVTAVDSTSTDGGGPADGGPAGGGPAGGPPAEAADTGMAVTPEALPWVISGGVVVLGTLVATVFIVLRRKRSKTAYELPLSHPVRTTPGSGASSMKIVMLGILSCAISALIILGNPLPVWAHGYSTETVVIQATPEKLMGEAEIAFTALGFTDDNDSGALEQNEFYQQLSRVNGDLLESLRQNTRIECNGKVLSITTAWINPPDFSSERGVSATSTVAVAFHTTSPGESVRSAQIRWAFPSLDTQLIFQSGETTLVSGLNEDSVAVFEFGFWASVNTFLLQGIDHIALGADHLLFLVVLALGLFKVA